MATRYLDEATAQLAPVYDQQIGQLESQIPAIQNLYNTLTQALQQQNQQQLTAGTQGIVEDASARGVLRSTLPVDARQSLTASLGTALNQGLSNLGLQQTQQVGGIYEKVGGLRTQRAGNIADLARSLETQDLEKQKLELQRIEAERNYGIQQQQLAIQRQAAAAAGRSSGGSSASVPQWQVTQQALSAVAQSWKPGKDGYVSPNQWNKFRSEWASAGFSTKSFDEQFKSLVNPAHAKIKSLTKYAGFGGK